MASRSFGFCLRIAFVSMLAVWLSGCGLPPALSIISSLAEGISFAANGKSISGVALSAMTAKDCAVYRIITNEDVCVEATDGYLTVRKGETALTAAASDLTTDGAVLEGFTNGTELFALVLDDGTLEIFSHLAADADDRSNMRLVARIGGYGTAPEAFRSLRLNGNNISVVDIIV